MTPTELREAARQSPFVPFRLLLRDGRALTVGHPRLLLVGKTFAVVGVPPPGSVEPYYQRTVTVNLADVVKLEPVPAAASQGQTG
jgi:hypothetical protein